MLAIVLAYVLHLQSSLVLPAIECELMEEILKTTGGKLELLT